MRSEQGKFYESTKTWPPAIACVLTRLLPSIRLGHMNLREKRSVWLSGLFVDGSKCSKMPARLSANVSVHSHIFEQA